MSDVIMVIVFIAVPLVVGMLSARAAGNSKKKYEAFRQPPLSPPGFLFPIVWTILYVLMGISSYLAYKGCLLYTSKTPLLWSFGPQALGR